MGGLVSVAAVFTGRACPACGWNESSRNAGAACFVCRAPMVEACPQRAPERAPSITRPAAAWDEPGPFCETCSTENLPGAYRCQVCGGRCKRGAFPR